MKELERLEVVKRYTDKELSQKNRVKQVYLSKVGNISAKKN